MKENITVYPTDIKRIIKEHYKHFYANKFDNLGEINSLKNTIYQNLHKMT